MPAPIGNHYLIVSFQPDYNFDKWTIKQIQYFQTHQPKKPATIDNGKNTATQGVVELELAILAIGAIKLHN